MFLRKQFQETQQFHLNDSSILLSIFIKALLTKCPLVSFGQHFTIALKLNTLLENRH